MRCEECLELVEDYFDAELDGPASALVAEHLEACAPCSLALLKLESERELYLRYECDAQPAPAFWNNVMTEATRGRAAPAARQLSPLRGWLDSLLSLFSAPRFSPSLTALIVLVAIGVTAFVMSYVNRRDRAPETVKLTQVVSDRSTTPSPLPHADSGPSNQREEREPQEDHPGAKNERQAAQMRGAMKNRSVLVAGREEIKRSNRQPSLSDSKPTPDELVREAEQKYVAAIAMLSRDVSRRRSRLDAKMAARFERTLAAIDHTIADTRRAARQHPGDPVAAQYMLTAYARKVDVLREMVGY